MSIESLHHEIRGSGPPLVLLMGLGAGGGVWEQHVKVYERNFTCVLIDNRGVGRSPIPPGPYTTAEMADDVAALMDRIGIDTAMVNGISMGGAIAQSLALRHPRKVSKLVLVSSWARCDAYAKAVFMHFQEARAGMSPAAFMRLLQLWIWTPGFFDAHEEEMAKAQDEAGANPQPQPAFIAQCEACITHDTQDDLSSIKVPTLITAGDLDIFTPLVFAQELRSGIPSSHLSIFAGSGHAHHWEDIARFNQETTEFLQSS
jgi:pimeloyl-ACP methyl ester carboxylesterase